MKIESADTLSNYRIDYLTFEVFQFSDKNRGIIIFLKVFSQFLIFSLFRSSIYLLHYKYRRFLEESCPRRLLGFKPFFRFYRS